MSVKEASEHLDKAVRLLTAEMDRMVDGLPRRRLSGAVDAARTAVRRIHQMSDAPTQSEYLAISAEFLPNGLDYLD